MSDTKRIIIEAHRTGYSPEQIDEPMTVGELKRILEDYDDDAPIYLSHDRGYTYGSFEEYDIREEYKTADGEWETDW